VTAASGHRLVIAPSPRRQLAELLPQGVAAAAHEFIVGPLLDNPYRVGKRLQPPLTDRLSARRGTYRVIYRVDDQQVTVTVLAIVHRNQAYRSP
jgi:mRNA interferase RelE/StbE